MTTSSMRGGACALLVAVGLFAIAAAPARAAKPYPTNKCVGAKLKGSATYCGAVLKAWSTWDKKQDAAKRDAAIAKAQTKLDAAWAMAEAKSSADGVDCAQTTLSAADLGMLVGTAAAQLTTAVNTGLDLGAKDDAKCGAALLKLAAKQCKADLLAEGKFVAKLDKDPDRLKRDEKRSKAAQKFSEGWAKVFAKAATRRQLRAPSRRASTRCATP